MLSNRRQNAPVAPTTKPTTYVVSSTAPVVQGIDLESEPHCKPPGVLTTTTASLPGYRVHGIMGAIHGMSTCAPPGRDDKNFLKRIIPGAGGESRSLTHMLYKARDQAFERMSMDCVRRGANAVVDVKFVENEVMGVVHVAIQGTAVAVEKDVAVVGDPFVDFEGDKSAEGGRYDVVSNWPRLSETAVLSYVAKRRRLGIMEERSSHHTHQQLRRDEGPLGSRELNHGLHSPTATRPISKSRAVGQQQSSALDSSYHLEELRNRRHGYGQGRT